MSLQASRAGECTKQQCLKFEQGTHTKLAVAGLKRGNTVEDEEAFAKDFSKLRGLHKCRQSTLTGFARTFARHDYIIPKRLVRLIGKKGLDAARNVHCERACSTGVLFKEAKQANHHIQNRPRVVALHREMVDELHAHSPLPTRKRMAAAAAGPAENDAVMAVPDGEVPEDEENLSDDTNDACAVGDGDATETEDGSDDDLPSVGPDAAKNDGVGPHFDDEPHEDGVVNNIDTGRIVEGLTNQHDPEAGDSDNNIANNRIVPGENNPPDHAMGDSGNDDLSANGGDAPSSGCAMQQEIRATMHCRKTSVALLPRAMKVGVVSAQKKQSAVRFAGVKWCSCVTHSCRRRTH